MWKFVLFIAFWGVIIYSTRQEQAERRAAGYDPYEHGGALAQQESLQRAAELEAEAAAIRASVKGK